MLDDVARLRALRTIAELRSFSRAADELGYTQSAVSQQIAALEGEVGLTLLNRGVRPIALTDAGQVLVDHTEPVLEQLATADARLAALRGVESGRLRVAAFPSAFGTFLPGAVAQFRRSHPGVEVELVEEEPDDSIPRLRAGGVDVAVAYQFGGDISAGAYDGLEREPLFDDEHRVVIPARHRLAARESVRLADLAGEEWIVPRADGPARDYRKRVEKLCAETGFSPRVSFESDDVHAVQAFVAAGLGIALMHDLTMPTRRRSIAVRPLAGSHLVRPVFALTVAGRRMPAATAMLDVLRDVA